MKIVKSWYIAKKIIKKKNKNKCILSGKTMKILDIHHLEDASNNPKKRLDLNNLVPLDPKIHDFFHVFYMGGYDKPCSKYDFDSFALKYFPMSKYTIKVIFTHIMHYFLIFGIFLINFYLYLYYKSL